MSSSKMEVDDSANVEMNDGPQVGAGGGDDSNDSNHFDHFDKVDVPEGVVLPQSLVPPHISFEEDSLAIKNCLRDAFDLLSLRLRRCKEKDDYITTEAAEVLIDSMPLEEFGRLWNGYRTEGLGVLVAKLKKPREERSVDTMLNLGTAYALQQGYKKPFLGSAAEIFFQFLCDTKTIDNRYARAVSIVQSSGTGKSRMMTAVAGKVFTLPMCIRAPDGGGYPPTDSDVYKYFKIKLKPGDDASLSSHAALASFFASAYSRMYEWLVAFHTSTGASEETLHKYWYDIMESREPEGAREKFFKEVIDQIKALSSPPSPNGMKKNEDREPFLNTVLSFYKPVKESSECLFKFLRKVARKQSTIFITYIDEAHELGQSYWSLLRLLHKQDPALYMWFLFAGTKTSLSYYAPEPKQRPSLRLQSEMQSLIPPYVTLDFDQNITASVGLPHTMGDLCSVRHLAKYGRPLWSAFNDSEIYLIPFACSKLTTGVSKFSPEDADHVFAILSQRISLDPVIWKSEALALADRSVANHMRLLTGVSDNQEMFYTASPSEPILALAAARYMYQPGIELQEILKTLSQSLCQAGLIEKGLFGELAARFLLLIARDYASIPSLQHINVDINDDIKSPEVHLRHPVRLLDFLHTLLGNDEWRREAAVHLDDTFGSTYVNFTHWMVAKEPLPKEDNQKLLANLWARGAALQCCFNQDAIDCVIPTYNGPVSPESIFNAEHMSDMTVQIKLTQVADTEAEFKLRSVRTFQNVTGPSPYIALLLNLGTESNHATGSKIKVVPPTAQASYVELKRRQLDADNGGSKNQKVEAQRAVNAFNRYLISVRGVQPSTYTILTTAKIEQAFDTFMKIVNPGPFPQSILSQHADPIGRFTGHCTDWWKD